MTRSLAEVIVEIGRWCAALTSEDAEEIGTVGVLKLKF
jgi:hypothetical protein